MFFNFTACNFIKRTHKNYFKNCWLNIFYVSCYTMTISVVRVLTRCSTIQYFLLDTHISSILVNERDKLWTFFFKKLWLLRKFDVNCRLIWFGERGGEHMKISKSWQNVTASARVFNLFSEHYECVHVFLDNDSGDDWVTNNDCW